MAIDVSTIFRFGLLIGIVFIVFLVFRYILWPLLGGTTKRLARFGKFEWRKSRQERDDIARSASKTSSALSGFFSRNKDDATSTYTAINKTAAQLKALKGNFAKLETNLKKDQTTIASTRRTIQKMNTQLKDSIVKLDKYQGIPEAEESKSAAAAQISQLDEIDESLNAMEGRNAQLVSQMTEKTQQIERIIQTDVKQLEQFSARLKKEGLTNELKEQLQQFEGTLNQIGTLEEELGQMADQRSQINNSINQTIQQTIDIKKNVDIIIKSGIDAAKKKKVAS